MPERPNIVLIIADDLGYADLGCYGGEIETPALDQLGRSGVRMTQFYTTPRCAPSRASLLTGLFPHQTGLGDLTSDDRPWGYPGSLDPECVTVAEMLRDAGYATSLSGKWHLSGSATEPDGAWPTRRGFDEFYGIINGATNYFTAPTLMDGETRSAATAEPDFYFTDAIGQHAADFIRRQSAADQPFFSYVAFTAPHFPLHAPAADIAAYDGVYDAGWDTLRRARLDRMIAEGVVPPDTPLGHREPGRRAWADVPHKQWQAHRMQVYAAQVARMDAAIAGILDALDEMGTREETLVLFLSDNGGCSEPVPPGRKRVTADGRPVRVGNDPSITPGTEDTHCSYGPDWASLSNTPFRLYKRWTHEGGISTPFIAHWPAGQVAGGRIVDQPHQVNDVTATLTDVVGLSSAPGPQPMGRSMLTAWHGDAAAPPTPLFWEHIGNAAVRHGRWKLVRETGQPWELYDIETDRIEAHDLSGRHPGLVAQLAAQWDDWAERVGVIPYATIAPQYHRKGRYVPRDRTIEL